MPVLPAKKIDIFAYNGVFDKILEKVHELGIVQITKAGEEFEKETENFDLSKKKDIILQQVKYTLDFLSGFFKKEKMLKKLLEGPREVGKEEFVNALSDFDYKEIYNQTRDLSDRLNGIKNKREEISAIRSEITPYIDLGIPVDEWRGTVRTSFFVGSVPLIKWQGFTKDVEKFEDVIHFEKIGEDKKDVKFYLILLNDYKNDIVTVLRKYNFSQLKPPENFKGTVKHILSEIKNIEETLEFDEAKIKILPSLL